MKLLLFFICLFGPPGCIGQIQTEPSNEPKGVNSDKILIVYLSRTKNTQAVPALTD